MKRRIYGLENEYGLVVERPPGGAAARIPAWGIGPLVNEHDEAISWVFRFMFAAAPNYKTLSMNPRVTDLFLGNGARLYRDVGNHPEYATPECDTLRDLVAADAAGARIVEAMLLAVPATRRATPFQAPVPAPRAVVLRNNTDQHSFATGGVAPDHTYGCHENYLTARSTITDETHAALAAHLISRMLYTGAGKALVTTRDQVSTSPPEITFVMSQRAEHIESIAADATVEARPLISTRDESHASDELQRVHVIAGDSNMSEWATFMKVGTTSLVLRLLEDPTSERPAWLGTPMHVQTSIRAVAADLTGNGVVAFEDGTHRTALQIQRDLQRAVATHLERDGGNAEDREVVEEWNLALTAFEHGTAETDLHDRVDWVIKKRLIDQILAKRKVEMTDPEGAAVARDIDTRYHDIRRPGLDQAGRRLPCGLFYMLQAAGRTRRMVTDELIEQRRTEAPPTRAARRGELIKQAARGLQQWSAQWSSVTIQNVDGVGTAEKWTIMNPFGGGEVHQLKPALSGGPRAQGIAI